MARLRSAVAIAAILVMAPMMAPAEARESCEVAPPEPDDVLILVGDTSEDARYAAFQEILTEDQIDFLDGLTAEPFFLPPDDIPGNLNMTTEVTGTLEVARATGEPTAEIIKTALKMAEGSAPTLRTFVYIHEKSGHRDRWDVSIRVRAIGDSCEQLGKAYEALRVEDNYARDDSGLYYLDIPLAQVTTQVENITRIDVEVRSYHSISGWWTGKNKERRSAADDDTIEIVVET